MKQRMQGMVMGMLVMALFLGTVPVSAAPQTIQAVFGNIRTTLFGQEFTVTNTAGEVLQPFVANGTVYVPVETILRALGRSAQWDAATGVLNFGTVVPPEQQALAPPPVEQQPQRRETMLGRDIQAFRLDNMFESSYGVATIMGMHYLHGFGVSARFLDRNSTISIFYNIGSRYTTLIGYVGPDDSSAAGRSGTFSVFGDGVWLESFGVSTGAPLRPFTVDVSGVTQLRIDFTPTFGTMQFGTSGFQFAIVDAVLG